MIATTEAIWHEFNAGLKQFIRRYVPDESFTDDILQDVFVKIHTHINTLHDQDKLPAWVYQIARNAIFDYYRARRVDPMPPEMPYLPDDPFDDVVAELVPCVKEMVDSLPAHYRQALIMTDYEGMSQKALGERLGLSFSGAKSRVQRARQQIKQMLLDCCHFQFDSYGTIIDYQPRRNCNLGQRRCAATASQSGLGTSTAALLRLASADKGAGEFPADLLSLSR